MNIAFTITGTGKISAFVGEELTTVETDHPNYSGILQALKNRDYETFANLAKPAKKVSQYVSGDISIKDGVIAYQGTEIHNTLTKRIMHFMQEGLPFEPLLKFLENLMQNPSYRAVNELYDFLEVGELPITEDGCFLAFKNVRADYYDIHSGTKRNMIGDKPDMPRNMVDEDANRTCSRGLHFCSIKYLPHFSDSNGGHTMILKVNPADVVAIPADYNNTKGRACKYEVVAEYTDNWRERADKDNGFDSVLYSSDGDIWEDGEDDYDDDYDDDCEDCGCICDDCCNARNVPVDPNHRERDSKGRFVKK